MFGFLNSFFPVYFVCLQLTLSLSLSLSLSLFLHFYSKMMVHSIFLRQRVTIEAMYYVSVYIKKEVQVIYAVRLQTMGFSFRFKTNMKSNFLLYTSWTVISTTSGKLMLTSTTIDGKIPTHLYCLNFVLNIGKKICICPNLMDYYWFFFIHMTLTYSYLLTEACI